MKRGMIVALTGVALLATTGPIAAESIMKVRSVMAEFRKGEFIVEFRLNAIGDNAFAPVAMIIDIVAKAGERAREEQDIVFSPETPCADPGFQTTCHFTRPVSTQNPRPSMPEPFALVAHSRRK
mgnify:CR=1 FL=1